MTESTVRFAEGFPLPLEIVTQSCAILARRGWGKTYAAKKLFEGMFEAGAQVVVVDPVGVWYGLRTGADGVSPGLKVPIVGGLNGDVQLSEDQAEPLARLLVESGSSAVVDVSMFSKGARQRFVAKLCEEVFCLKKTRRTAMHIIFEEAQVFAPQRVPSGSERLLGAVEDLCRLGRNFGIGFTLVSQRPQSVNKEVLNQCEVLVVGQISGAHERKAIEAWIQEQGLSVAELVADLPGLQQGEGFLWSPSWLQECRRIQVEELQTMDSSSTPLVMDERVDHRSVKAAAVNVEGIAAALRRAEEAVKEEDPAHLRRRISELEKELREARAAPPVVREVSVFTEEDLAEFRGVHGTVAKTQHLLDSVRGDLQRVERLILLVEGIVTPRRDLVPSQPRSVPGTSSPVPAAEVDIDGLPRGQAKVIVALRQCGGSATGKRVAMLAGYSVRSSTIRNICSGLRKAGLIEGSHGGTLTLTEEGGAAAACVPPLPTGQALRDYWSAQVPGGAPSAVFEALLRRYPDELSYEDLEEETGYSASSSTLRNALSKLRTLEFVDGRGAVKASDDLFSEVGP